jgi:ligand-binding sensor domain-containing protein/signal transduction histidine kinase
LGLRTLLLAMIGLGLARPALALDPGKSLAECSVQTWRVRDGLPAAWVRALAQTPDGYLWIGTAGGLGRHDGAGVQTVSTDGPLGRLTDIIDLGVGRDGTLWLLPSVGEPACRRGRTLGACFPARLSTTAARPYLVQEDAAGAIWMSAKEGLFRYAGGQLALVHPPATLPFQRPNALHGDRRGRLWVGAPGGLFVEESGKFHLHAGPEGPIEAPIQSFHESASGHLWAAANRALIRIDVATGATAAFPHRFPSDRPTQMIEDRDGNLWIGGYGGLTRFRDGEFTLFTTRDGLPDDDVTAVFEDREASLWVGTRSGGLAQFSDRTLDTRAGPPSLRGLRVETVAEDAAGTMWFGSQRGLTRWRGGEERTFRAIDGLPSDHVTVLLPGPDGVLWVGTDRGLGRLRDEHFDQPVSLSTMISALYFDRSQVLWIGSEEGLSRLEGATLRSVPNAPDLDPRVVRGIQQDGSGTLWVATIAGLARVEKETLVRVRALGGVNVRHARSLHTDPGGRLWIGTAHNGLVRVEKGQARGFAAAEGLAFDQLYQMLSDDQGFLWVGTNRGILRLDANALDQVARGARQRIDPNWFDTSDERRDVSATRARQPGAWKSRDGRLWFATDQGIFTIDPRRLRLDTVPPPVWIELLEVDGRATRRDEPHQFPPGAGNLEIHFSGVSLLEPQKVAHRYQLEGYDRHWVDAGVRRAAYYTNLPPGHYRFRVQARNADGVWNEAGDSLELELAPHLYQRGWFYGLCGLMLAAGVLAAHRSRLGRVQARYQAVLAERGRLARELHDSLLQALSAVSMQIYALRKRLGPTAPVRPPETIARELEAIEQVVAAGLQETRRYVWNLREQASGEGLPARLSQLLARLFDGRSVEHRLAVEGEPSALPESVEVELLRIVQEAVTNALKHADARHIEVRLCYELEGVKLSVRDDGRGFEPEQVAGARAGHFGLVGMRERAARLGQLSITSAPGRGTTVALALAAEMSSGDA